MNVIVEQIRKQASEIKKLDWIVTEGPNDKFSVECPEQTMIVNPVFDMSNDQIKQILGFWSSAKKNIDYLIELADRLEAENIGLMAGMSSVIEAYLRQDQIINTYLAEKPQEEIVQPTVGVK